VIGNPNRGSHTSGKGKKKRKREGKCGDTLKTLMLFLGEKRKISDSLLWRDLKYRSSPAATHE